MPYQTIPNNIWDKKLNHCQSFFIPFRCLQGLLSTTYIVDVGYEYEGEEEIKSIFVKIPLRENGLNTFHEVNPTQRL